MCDGQMFPVWCSLHISVQWDVEKGEQEGHGEDQRCYYLGEAAGSAEAQFRCLLLLAIVHLCIFLQLLLRPRPFPFFLCDNCTENGLILPNFPQLFPAWPYLTGLGSVFSCCLLTVEQQRAWCFCSVTFRLGPWSKWKTGQSWLTISHGVIDSSPCSVHSLVFDRPQQENLCHPQAQKG